MCIRDRPRSESPAGGANSANFFDISTGGYAVTGSATFDSTQNYLTDVGAYTSSVSPYGTFDQGGNVSEWNEAVIGFSFRGIRGGSWGDLSIAQDASFRGNVFPTIEDSAIGFRVASIPEPGSGLLLLLATVGLLKRRRRLSTTRVK